MIVVPDTMRTFLFLMIVVLDKINDMRLYKSFYETSVRSDILVPNTMRTLLFADDCGTAKCLTQIGLSLHRIAHMSHWLFEQYLGR